MKTCFVATSKIQESAPTAALKSHETGRGCHPSRASSAEDGTAHLRGQEEGAAYCQAHSGTWH